MEIEHISLQEALQIFNRRDSRGMLLPFDISVRTFSGTTKKGGSLKVYEGVKYLPPANPKDNLLPDITELFSAPKVSRNPNHFKNRTRNIELTNGEIKTINIDFIIFINNCKVIY